MRYGISMPPFQEFADPRVLAETAREAEDAGWDGFFIWDHMLLDPHLGFAIADPEVALAAVAARTTRIRLGTLVTPVSRRRPWKLAREVASLDLLSGGRMTLGVGLGEPAEWEMAPFGEETDAKSRAALLDEGLAILAGAWSGEPFAHDGTRYSLPERRYLPVPVQRPRVPIWVAGIWPNKAPMRRAARWDGVAPLSNDHLLTPDEWRDILAYIGEHRPNDRRDDPFDAIATGVTPGDDRAAGAAIVAAYAEAGCTWWMEDISHVRFSGGDWSAPWTPTITAQMRERVRQGPPRG